MTEDENVSHPPKRLQLMPSCWDLSGKHQCSIFRPLRDIFNLVDSNNNGNDPSSSTFDLDDMANLFEPSLSTPKQVTSSAVDMALVLLQQLFPNKPDVTFRCKEQQAMVEAALSRQQNFVGILPTGGGKSIIFQIPALVEDELMTLVVIPNVPLMNDILAKTTKLGISCCKWTAQKQNTGNAAVVFLAVESIASQSFKQYVCFL
jgi:hypothetical protein